MTDLTHAPSLSLLERTRDLATMSEDELRRLAAEAARDRDEEALWALLEVTNNQTALGKRSSTW